MSRALSLSHKRWHALALLLAHTRCGGGVRTLSLEAGRIEPWVPGRDVSFEEGRIASPAPEVVVVS
jgi:hypothetical protein